jgi:hypothetical protein
MGMDRAIPVPLLYAPFAGLVGVGIYAFVVERMQVFAVGAAVATAAYVLGILTGFLFGIPRALTRNSSKDEAFEDNTNLEQISDWLTKIIVGVGLIEVGSWVPGIQSLGDSVGAAMVGGNNVATYGADVFAIALMLFALISGFLLMYINTRTTLRRRFTQEHLAERNEAPKSSTPKGHS